MNLCEAYAKRLQISESVYSQNHTDKMSTSKKLMIAKVLDNTNKFLSESIDSSVATQARDMGLFKKFSLNLTTVALPNLIADELVMVSPMSAMSGYVNYLEYSYSTNKGETKAGDVVNSPFSLGDVNPNYTSSKVVETIAEGQTELAWGPVLEGSIEKFENNAWTKVEGEYTPVAGDKVRYIYNNVVIPQTKLPTLKVEMKTMPLLAKARRIAVYYSQIAAFQAKTDYGFDLGDQLAEKAVGQLSYEIDTEVVKFLADIAEKQNEEGDFIPAWDRTVPAGISKAEHYEGFAEAIEYGRQIIYDRTKRFAPNYMVIASNILPIITFLRGFKAAPAKNINGPYFAGTLNSLKVFVSPTLEADKYFLGVNGDDMMSSAAVYAPYMAIVPTQLLQYADGGTSQGWSTMYDLRELNKLLVVAGSITGDMFGTVGSSNNAPFYTKAATNE